MPRSTGDVRVGYDETVSTLACVRTPLRCVAVEFDAAEVAAGDTGDAVVFSEALVEEGEFAVEQIEDAAVFFQQRREEKDVSRRIASRRSASNSGKRSGSGEIESRLRSSSH